jgi:spermidine/putrescine transport system ATP-binding protein
MTQPIIELIDIEKSFHDQSVLSDINLIIYPGEFLTLLGPSGCGKTTLLRMISGFETPDKGKVLIEGRDMKETSPHLRHVNTVFQNYALFPHMDVFDNVAFGLRCQKVPETEVADRVLEMLTIVHLEKFIYRKPEQLSGGQQQRVAIARALVNKPIVLLLDEPLSALDYRLRKNMQIELKALQRQLGLTFICVTHDQEEALSMSDRVAVMEQGKIIQLGSPREVYEEPQSMAVAKFIGEANFIKTDIIEANDTTLTVEIEGKKLSLQNRRKFSTHDKVVTLLRPEDLKVWGNNEVTATEKDTLYHGRVETVVYKGSTVDLIVRLDSGTHIHANEFFDEDDENLEYKVGESVWIEWFLGWEVVLPNES